MKKAAYTTALFVATSALALANEAATATSGRFSDFEAAGAAIAMGLAVLGGTLAQGKAASAALEGISRNPNAAGKVTTPMILGLVFIESLIIFTLLIAFRLLGVW